MANVEWAEATRERIDRLAGHLNGDMLRMMLYDSITEDDPRMAGESRDELESLLGAYEPRLWDSQRPVITAPKQKDLEGELRLGRVYQGDVPMCDFRLPLDRLTRHIGIYGQTGHAKTTLFFHLQSQLIEAGVPFLAFDPKNDCRAMLRKDERMTVVPWRRLQWNPLRPPPGMPVHDWWANLSQITGYSFGWFVASSNYLQQQLDTLYDRFMETGRLPTIAELQASISQTSVDSRRKADYHDSVENRIQTLVSVMGDCFVRAGIPLEALVSRPCSVELSGLRPAEANWLVETILSWIYFYRMYSGHRGERLRHVIFVDECHRIFDRSKEYRETAVEMGTPMIAVFPSQFRDFGTGMVFASQTPSQTMNAVNANTVVKIVGNLSSGLDMESVSDAMGLDYEIRDSLHKLKRGQWIVRMSDGWTEPFLIETPDYPRGADVSEADVEERLERELGQYLAKEVKSAGAKAAMPVTLLPEISEGGWQLLRHVNEHPFTGCASRYKALSLSGRRAQSAKSELVAKKLATEVEVALGGYRPVKFIVLTPYGIDVLRSMDCDVRLWKHTGHMGFRHQLYLVLIAYSLEKCGWAVRREKALANGRRVDIYAVKDDRTMAVEVELGDFDPGAELKALEEVDEIVIVTEGQAKDIGASDRVRVCRASDFLAGLRSNNNSNTFGNFSINPDNLISNPFSGNEPGIKAGDNNA